MIIYNSEGNEQIDYTLVMDVDVSEYQAIYLLYFLVTVFYEFLQR